MDKYVIKLGPKRAESPSTNFQPELKVNPKFAKTQPRNLLRGKKNNSFQRSRSQQSTLNSIKNKIHYIQYGMLAPLFPDFKVDNFWCKRSERITFFLSHMHEDHLQGLSVPNPNGTYQQPRKEWAYGTIYTSQISAKLLIMRFPHLRPYVRPLKTDHEYEIEGRKVTLIESNHCPGAVMFHISSEKGTILHTGDFRYSPKMLESIAKIQHLKEGEKPSIDYLYLDNTFGTSDESFPSQQVAYAQLSELIATKRKENPKYKFNIYCYTLGKEEVFFNLAEQFGTKIMMMKDRFSKCQSFGAGTNHFVTKQDYDVVRDGQIYIHARQMRDRPENAIDVEKRKDTIEIVLTGWRGQYNIKHSRYFKVPYSSHSSPDEIEAFVKNIKPKTLVFNLQQKPDLARQNFQTRLVTKYTQEGIKAVEEMPDCQEKSQIKGINLTQGKLNFSASAQKAKVNSAEKTPQAKQSTLFSMFGSKTSTKKISPSTISAAAVIPSKSTTFVNKDEEKYQGSGEEVEECSELPDHIKEITTPSEWPFVEIDEVCRNPRGVNNKQSLKKRSYQQLMAGKTLNERASISASESSGCQSITEPPCSSYTELHSIEGKRLKLNPADNDEQSVNKGSLKEASSETDKPLLDTKDKGVRTSEENGGDDGSNNNKCESPQTDTEPPKTSKTQPSVTIISKTTLEKPIDQK